MGASYLKRSMNNAQTDSLQLWLDMIRTVKESEIMLRRENQTNRTCMQSITTFLLRPEHAKCENYFILFKFVSLILLLKTFRW